MNSNEEMEALLARVVPAPLSSDLMARLEMARPPVKKSASILRLWLPLAAAAGVTIAWLWPAPTASPPDIAKTPERKPVGSVQHLMEVSDLGIVVGENDQPVRLIRTRWIDEIYYAPANGGNPEKEGRVREEVLPVSLEIY